MEPQQQQENPSANNLNGSSATAVSSSDQVVLEEQEEENVGVQVENHGVTSTSGQDQQQLLHEQHQPSTSSSSSSSSSSEGVYRINISISDVAPSDIRDDVCSCLIVLVTFCFFASMTLILGLFGSEKLQVGPNTSHLVQTNPFFVQSIQAQLIDDSKPGPVLYGFYEPPPLDSEITWTEIHKATIPVDLHKEWIFFLNKGSKVDIFYTVNSTSLLPLSLVIAKGRESLVEWIDDPSYPNSTLSWNIIYGTGKIQQEIYGPAAYYIAVGNLNSEEVEVDLRFTITAMVYNTTQAYYRCSLGTRLCTVKLILFGTTAAVLTSPGPEKGATDWHVKLSYGPRWMVYLVGSGVMTVFLLLLFRVCNMFQSSDRNAYQPGENTEPEQAPLLLHKDEDCSSWGSSHDSQSHNEDLDECFAVKSDGKSFADGENLRRLCVICFDAPRDSFFLPCGHCAICFNCGTRIAEEAGNCPICRRRIKKVRRIFNV